MEDTSTAKQSAKYGAFTGVFLPTLLTILGAVLYLRTGWLVGHGGLLLSLGVVVFSTLITLATALSFLSVLTNIEISFGGLFPIIGRSLGFEAGGSVTIPFYLAQSISVAFYLFAFAEGWTHLFPDHDQTYIVIAAFLSIFALALLDMKIVNLVRIPIALVVLASLISIFAGPGLSVTPSYQSHPTHKSFWDLFSVFFPAVTGVTTGVNLSGTLQKPRRDIPRGTIAAWVLSTLIYLLMVVWVAHLAPNSDLQSNMTILVERSFYGPAVLMGILAATLSAALNSMVGAPQILYAIAESGLLPGKVFAKIDDGIPRPAVALTALIALVTIAVGLGGGGLNRIAPLMTMFFLIVYAVLNATVLLEQQLGLISFRPLWRIPKWVSAFGLIGALIAMIAIEPRFALMSSVSVALLYDYLSRRHLETDDGDLRSGLLLRFIQWAVQRAQQMPKLQYRAWQPNLLIPFSRSQTIEQSAGLLEALVMPRGTLVFLNLNPDASFEEDEIVGPFREQGIFCKFHRLRKQDPRVLLQVTMQLARSSLLRPNTVFYLVDPLSPFPPQFVLEESIRDDFGAIFVCPPKSGELKKPKTVHVWIREQSPLWAVSLRLSNLDLALLLALQIARNSGAQLHLYTVVADPSQQEAGEGFIRSLVEQGRLPSNSQTRVWVGTFLQAFRDAPCADFNIFGLSTVWNTSPMDQEDKFVESTSLFVRDSGLESAMA